MYVVYVLQSSKDIGWYIGCTADIRARLASHRSGGVRSTKDRRPLRLIYAEIYLDRRDAFGREKFLKSGSGRRFLKKQLRHFVADEVGSRVT